MEVILARPRPDSEANLPEPKPKVTGYGTLDLLDEHGDVRPLEDIEEEVLRFAILHYRGQMSEVSRRLAIGRSTLYRKVEGLTLEGADDQQA